MSKTVACLVIKTPKVFTWLGHMPIMNWSLSQLHEVRGIDRIVCVADSTLVERASTLLAKEKIDVISIPKDLSPREEALDTWLANGPASDAGIIVVTKATSPFMPATKIEACIAQVSRGKCSVCVPARSSSVVALATFKQATTREAVDGFRVRRVNVIKEDALFSTIRVNLMESLDVNNHDEFILASALVESDKV